MWLFPPTVVHSGTTLNLLKFPIINPTPYRMFRRQERLKEASQQKESELLPEELKRLQYFSKQGYLVGKWWRSRKDEEVLPVWTCVYLFRSHWQNIPGWRIQTEWDPVWSWQPGIWRKRRWRGDHDRWANWCRNLSKAFYENPKMFKWSLLKL